MCGNYELNTTYAVEMINDKRIFSHTFTGTESVGGYRFGGRVIKWVNGEMLCEDIEPFVFNP